MEGLEKFTTNRGNPVDECFALDIMSEAPADNEKVTAFADYVLQFYIEESASFLLLYGQDLNLKINAQQGGGNDLFKRWR